MTQDEAERLIGERVTIVLNDSSRVTGLVNDVERAVDSYPDPSSLGIWVDDITLSSYDLEKIVEYEIADAS